LENQNSTEQPEQDHNKLVHKNQTKEKNELISRANMFKELIQEEQNHIPIKFYLNSDKLEKTIAEYINNNQMEMVVMGVSNTKEEQRSQIIHLIDQFPIPITLIHCQAKFKNVKNLTTAVSLDKDVLSNIQNLIEIAQPYGMG